MIDRLMIRVRKVTDQRKRPSDMIEEKTAFAEAVSIVAQK